MLAARAAQCASKTAHVTRLASKPTACSTLRKSAALKYSTASAAAEAMGTGEASSDNAPKSPTGIPYASQFSEFERSFNLGEANPKRAKTMSRFLHQTQYELNLLHHRRRRLLEALKGPYKVRANAFARKERTENVRVEDGKVHVADKVVPNIWLRDNCQCATCMHDATRQRLLDTFSIPKDIAIKEHSLKKDDNALHIEWSDGHTSKYAYTLLRETLATDTSRAIQRLGLTKLSLWDSSVSSNPPVVSHEAVANGDIASLLRHLRKHGFCYVDNTPFDNPEDTKALLEKIAFIRETHYGGFYDFTADLASKDTAYTNISLEAHTDTTYFSDPAGLQAFHLLSHTEGEGGASLLVDGFKVADELLQTDPKAYEILATVNVHGHASGNDGISIQPYRGFPVLEHDIATGDLLRVRWNSSDRASIELPINKVEIWYDAARKFDALLKKKENEYWEQLKPGRVLIFDNWRVLHGRSSFTGKRRICGAYINRDDWISKFKIAEFGQGKVLEGLPVY